MRIPLFNRLKRQIHRDIALLQDEVLEVVYAISPDAILHGGTAIGRCYAGNRFSEDLDFYIAPGKKFTQSLSEALKQRGLIVQKIKETQNTVFCRISNGRAEVRLEAALRKPGRFEVREYEKADGTSVDVFTLSVDDLIIEKLRAYQSRRLARDLYDICSLSTLQHGKQTGNEVRAFIGEAKKPIDEKSLKAVVYSGAVPSFEQMIAVLKRRFGL